MSYQLPMPPASGAVVDPDGLTWRKDTNGVWQSTCQTCHTPMSPMPSWADLLRVRGPLEDAPAPLAGLVADGGPA